VENLPDHDLASLEALAKDGQAKLTLVAAWATWCVPCIEEMPTLSRFYEAHRDKGLRVLGLCMDDRNEMAEKVQAVLDRQRVSYPMAMIRAGTQDAFMPAVDPKWDGVLPATILFDGTGKKVGFLLEKLDQATLDRLVLPLLR
jgi:thiol-disulfide isomerase/thioredoxin